MSIKSEFTPAEWEQLQLTLAEVPNAVMAAEKGASILEKFALFGNQEDILERFRDTQLVHLLLVQNEAEATTLAQLVEDRGKRSATAAQIDALYLCRTAVALLRQKGATAQDIEAFRGVAVALAEKVANAAKEGGFLGIGGERVTAAESAILTEIRTALA